MTSNEALNALEERAKRLPISRLERRLHRLETRWVLFPVWRAEWLVKKIRNLRGK